jgi:archaellum component FlaC
MENEKDSVQMLKAIQGLSSQIGGLSDRMDGFSGRMDGFADRMDGFAKGQEKLQGSVKSLEEGQLELRGSVKSLEVGQQEIHEMIHEFSTHVDQRFNAVDCRFDSLEGRVTNIESKVTTMESKVISMDSKMVTKDYLDDKLADHGVRYGGLIRQTNEKVGMLADALVSERSLSAKAAKAVMSAEPFGRK